MTVHCRLNEAEVPINAIYNAFAVAIAPQPEQSWIVVRLDRLEQELTSDANPEQRPTDSMNPTTTSRDSAFSTERLVHFAAQTSPA
jgi:hypothetical protein